MSDGFLEVLKAWVQQDKPLKAEATKVCGPP